jgi:hypothetical protein
LAERSVRIPDEARLPVRFAGYCDACGCIVECTAGGDCMQGHDAKSVSGRLVLVDDDPVPRLPRFNWAAFLLPFIWGPAHELWVGLVFLPIWLFMETIVSTADKAGIPPLLGSVTVVVFTLAAQASFARRANGLAYRREIEWRGVGEYVRRERIWAAASAAVVALLVVWVVWFEIAVAPTLSR